MDILQLFQDYGIQYQTEGHKHCRPGWANVECPFCVGNPGLHLGVTLDGKHFRCWRCGGKASKNALSKLLNVEINQVTPILNRYAGISTNIVVPKVRIRTKAYKRPAGLQSCQNAHLKYLIGREFDPELIVPQWGLVATGPLSLLDGINYSRRILAPIIWDGEEVSFQARDITEKHPLKYMACPMERELAHHQHILYGDETQWGATGICVEGITDVWRLGPKSFACFGIEYTPRQIRAMARRFKRVFVVFDDDPQAIVQADKLCAELRFRGTEAVRIDIVGDPGAMKQSEADYLVKNLLNTTKYWSNGTNETN